MWHTTRHELKELLHTIATVTRKRWHEATKGRVRATITQGAYLGAMAWLAFQVATYGERCFEEGVLWWSTTKLLTLTWASILIIHCVVSSRWLKRGALLAGLCLAVTVAFHHALSSDRPLCLGFTLRFTVPQLVPLLPLFLARRGRPARPGRCALIAAAAVIALVPLVWLRLHGDSYLLAHDLPWFAVCLCVVVAGWLDPRVAVAGVILTLNSVTWHLIAHLSYDHTLGFHTLGLLTLFDFFAMMVVFSWLAISKAKLAARLDGELRRSS